MGSSRCRKSTRPKSRFESSPSCAGAESLNDREVYRNSLARALQLGLWSSPALECAHMSRKRAKLTVEKIVAQRPRDRAKGDLAPRHVVLLEQPHLDALGARTELEVDQAGAEHHVDLIDVWEADHGVKRADHDSRVRLLGGLACRASEYRFAVFKEACWQRPQSLPRLDRALAQQHLLAPHRQAANNDLGVLVMNRSATRAHVTRQGVSGRNAKLERRRAALTAELHGRMKFSR